ncbi:hypothetical protein FRC06_010725 [Ceratobasidium sp. 370]|nr:hypothetical protein FRC06_010725 [Ceratobasidium sp. 370]
MAILNGVGCVLVVSYFDDCELDPYSQAGLLGSDIYAALVLAFQGERQQPGYLLFCLPGSAEVSADEPIVVYVLTAALTAIDATTSLGSDLAFAGLMKPEFDKPNWRIPGIHVVLAIKSCLFLMEASVV